MKRIILLAGVALAFLISVLLTRTLLFTSTQVPVKPVAAPGVDETRVAQRLAEALRFQTVSHRDPERVDQAAFRAFRAHLAKTFPTLHARLQKEEVNGGSLLFTWPGRDTALKPIVLMAHHDVVPIAAETEQDWVHPPFGGVIADGYIWGRGALDNKSSLMGVFEAVEALLDEGFRPLRTVYLVSGHDEEIGGWEGATEIVNIMQTREIAPEFVLDEGGAIIQDAIPDLPNPVAAIGVSEKGYLTLELTVQGQAGHSSTPARHSAIGILSNAIAKIEEKRFPANMKYSAQFFDHVGPRMGFLNRMIFANLWLFSPLVERFLSASPTMDASIRTTIAPTMFNAGVKENVLPAAAKAVVNFRIMPGATVEAVTARIAEIVDDDRVSIACRGTPNEPSPVSPIHTGSYAIIENTIRQIVPGQDVIVAPYLTMAATDSRHFCQICSHVYRFLAFCVPPEELKGIHGVNERISVKNYAQMVKFYCHLLRNCEAL